jgi:hypothetical protein
VLARNVQKTLLNPTLAALRGVRAGAKG